MRIISLRNETLYDNDRVNIDKIKLLLNKFITKDEHSNNNIENVFSGYNNNYLLKYKDEQKNNNYMVRIFKNTLFNIGNALKHYRLLKKKEDLDSLILSNDYVLKCKDSIIVVSKNILDNMVFLRDFISRVNNKIRNHNLTIENSNSNVNSNSTNIVNNEVMRYKVLRMLIFDLFKAINILHNNNICHLNLNNNNILIEKNKLFNDSNHYNLVSAFIIKFINYNTNFDYQKKTISLDKLSKNSEYDLNIPYKVLSLERCKKYDIWNLSILIFELLFDKEFIYAYFRNQKSIDDVDKNIKHIFNNLDKFVFSCNFSNIKSGTFILNKIYIDEKYDE